MALYSRDVSHEARATDAVHTFILRYPNGVTLRQLMNDNSNSLKDANSVIAAIDLLQEEKKIRVEKSVGHAHHHDSIKVCPLIIKAHFFFGVIFWLTCLRVSSNCSRVRGG